VMANLSLIIKPTRQCTLRCIYCQDRRADNKQVMSFPVMARMTASALAEHDGVNFIWHGGEPTLLPIRFYEKAFLVQSRLRRPEHKIRNSFQTNATKLTVAWARFFRANRIWVGISIDGPAHLHDSHRSYHSGKGSYDDVMRGLNFLRDHEVQFSGLVVVDEGTLKLGAHKLLDFLVGQGELESLKAQIRNGVTESCTLSGKCWGHYYMIEPGGDVGVCDVFSGDPRYFLGNIMSNSFAEIADSAGLLQLKKEHRDAMEAMSGCPEFDVCKGWCPHERYVSIRHNKRHRDGCCGLRDLIAYVRSRLADEAKCLHSSC